MHDWTTRSFVATYSYRPDSTLEYLEDVLKCCIYWGQCSMLKGTRITCGSISSRKATEDT